MNAQIEVSSALAILADESGFFPPEYRDIAREIVEQRGTDEQKKLASQCVPRDPAQGPISRSLNRSFGL